jgi:hypothetical protein
LTSREPNEMAAGFISMGGFPLLAVIVLIGTDQVQDTSVSLEFFPLLFAALSAVLCRVLAVGFWWGAVYTLGCAATCWMSAVVVGLFDSLFLPW